MNQTERIKRKGIKEALYAFRETHGVPADLYLVTVGTPDFETGDKSVTVTKISIPQFITGSVALMKKFEYDISYIKANSNFAYGGFFEVGDRFGIVDGTYLYDQNGKFREIKQEDYIVYDGKRYDPKRILKLDAESGYLLHLRMVKGAAFKQIHEQFVYDTLSIEEDILGEL